MPTVQADVNGWGRNGAEHLRSGDSSGDASAFWELYNFHSLHGDEICTHPLVHHFWRKFWFELFRNFRTCFVCFVFLSLKTLCSYGCPLWCYVVSCRENVHHETFPSCATQRNIHHRSISVTWTWFSTSPHMPWYRQRNDTMDKQKHAPSIQSVLDLSKKSYPWSLSLSLSISPNKKDQYKANRYSRCLNPAWNFLFTNSPHQSLTVPFMKTPAVTTPRHHGVQLHLFSLWIPQLDRP